MDNEQEKRQFCLRTTPEAYEALLEMAAHAKSTSDRQWSTTALVNLLICENRDRVLRMKRGELDRWFRDYRSLRDGEATGQRRTAR